MISTIAGTGVMGHGGDGNLATSATIGYPYSVFVHNDEVTFQMQPIIKLEKFFQMESLQQLQELETKMNLMETTCWPLNVNSIHHLGFLLTMIRRFTLLIHLINVLGKLIRME